MNFYICWEIFFISYFIKEVFFIVSNFIVLENENIKNVELFFRVV